MTAHARHSFCFHVCSSYMPTQGRKKKVKKRSKCLPLMVDRPHLHDTKHIYFLNPWYHYHKHKLSAVSLSPSRRIVGDDHRSKESFSWDGNSTDFPYHEPFPHYHICEKSHAYHGPYIVSLSPKTATQPLKRLPKEELCPNQNGDQRFTFQFLPSALRNISLTQSAVSLLDPIACLSRLTAAAATR